MGETEGKCGSIRVVIKGTVLGARANRQSVSPRLVSQACIDLTGTNNVHKYCVFS